LRRRRIDGVEILDFHAVGTVAGAVPRQAAGRNGPGQGTLRIGAAGGALSWQAPGSAQAGAEVTITGDGVYLYLGSYGRPNDAPHWYTYPLIGFAGDVSAVAFWPGVTLTLI
jgi:hypothetical protein